MKTIKIFAVKRLLISAAFAAAAVLAIAACTPFVDPAEGTPLPTGKGRVTIQLGVDGAGQPASAARTLLPAAPLGFDSYDLTFTPVSGEPIPLTGHTALAVELDVGTYTLELKAYKGIELAAEGTASNIVVAAETETPVSVALGFKAMDTGTGTLAVTVTNASGLSISGAAIAWMPLSGGTEAGNKDIISNLAGNVTLKGGYYLVAVTLTNGERTAKRSDVAHIGAGQTTPLEWEFEEGDFATIVDYIRLVGIPEWGSGAPNAVEPDAENPDGTYTWLVEAATNATFRFILDDTSSYDDKWWARWFHPETNGMDVSAPASYEMKFSEDKPNLAWQLVSAGYYSLTVDPYAKTLTVAKPVVVTSVAIKKGSGEEITEISLPQGTENYQFTAEVSGHNAASSGVEWIISPNAHAGTTLTADGKLTIDENETVAADAFTITARSVVNPDKSASVTVSVTGKNAVPLPPPASAALSEAGVATWTAPSDGEDNVESYHVQLYKDGVPVVGTAETVAKSGPYSKDFLSAMRTGGIGSYTVKVKAVGDGTEYSDSPETVSEAQTIGQRDTPPYTWWIPNTTVAHWDTVSSSPNATDYTVNVYRGDVNVATPDGTNTYEEDSKLKAYVDLGSIMAEHGTGPYTFTVITKGNDTLILDSSETKRSAPYSYIATLPAPAKPTLSTGAVTWTPVAGAASYTVKLHKDETGLVETYTGQSSGGSVLAGMRSAGAGSYTVTVSAIGNGTDWLDSSESPASDAEEVSALEAPGSLAWSEGSATWNEVSGAASYTVKLYKGNAEVYTGNNASSPLNLATELTNAGSYTFTVQAIASPDTLYLDGEVSAASSAKQVGATASIVLSPSDKWSGTLEVAEGGTANIAKSSGSLTISVTDGSFSSFVWIVDGDVLEEQTGASITLSGTNYALGGHSVTVYALDTNGIPWSPPAPVKFTVTK